MSVLYRGNILNTDLTRNAMGGTEQMRKRLIENVESSLLSEVAIHFSRPQELYSDVPNILYCHDLADDPAIQALKHTWQSYDKIVFVSYWQRDQFITKFDIPYSKCVVIHNAIETRITSQIQKSDDEIRFIYHTTPHRGLLLAYLVFDALSQKYDNIHLDVFSSFGVYGWHQRDAAYQELFDKIKAHKNMTYHGAVSNDKVLEYLKKAHVFLYPSVWKETSCIALIEAMNSGCLAIYPSYGALPETGEFTSNIAMYEYDEDLSNNASQALAVSDWAIKTIRNDKDFIYRYQQNMINRFSYHTIDAFAYKWTSVITKCLERKK